MNNNLTITAVLWESRSWRNNKQAKEWCKNYGLRLLAKNFAAGRLLAKEMAKLREKFGGNFTNKTEKFYFITLCKSCYNGTVISVEEKQRMDYPDFEIFDRQTKKIS